MAARRIALGIVAATAVMGAGCGDGDSENAGPAAASPAHDAATALRRALASSLATAKVTVEPSCPPPGLLACRSAVRLTGTVRDGATKELRRDLAAGVPPALRRLGFRRIDVHQRQRNGELRGRALSDGERLARWRTRDRTFELVTGGLRL